DAGPPDLQQPPLSVVRGALLTTAGEDFGDHEGAFAASVDWHERILSALDRPAPYLACTAPGNNDSNNGLEALSFLRSVLAPEPAGVRVISNSDEHGICFLATATPRDAETVRKLQIAASKGVGGGGGGGGGASPLSYWAPLPSTLKLAPGLLSYGGNRGDHDNSNAAKRNDVGNNSRPAGRRNLDDGLTPGVLAARNRRWYESSVQLADEWRDELLSESLDVYGASFWSSGSSVGLGLEESHLGGVGGVEGALLAREWTRAADVLHDLGGLAGGPSIGQVCSWDEMAIYHTDDDLLTVKG
ncbi:unnamed protein product, partial [Laminaria digitata]